MTFFIICRNNSARTLKKGGENTVEILLDRDRTKVVFDKMMANYIANGYPYNQTGVEVPHAEKNLPAGLQLLTKEHAVILWISCFWMRGGIKSDTAVKSLTKVYDAHPELFIPELVQYEDPNIISKFLKGGGLGFQDVSAALWVENCSRLVEWWGGDPRNIFAGIENYQDPYEVLCERICHKKGRKKRQGFPGFQKKMVSMITYFFMESGMIPYFDFPLPVDFHVARKVLAHEMITVVDIPKSGNIYNVRVLDAARELSHEYAALHGVSSIELCNAVWLFSREMCSTNPQTYSTVGKRNGRKTVVTPVPLTWNEGQVKAEKRSCAMCVVSDTCKYIARPALYYVRGELILEERKTCPVTCLDGFALGDIDYVRPEKAKSNGEMVEEELLNIVPLFESVETATEPTTG